MPPQKPRFPNRLDLRISPRQAKTWPAAARRAKTSLNQFIRTATDRAIEPPKPKPTPDLSTQTIKHPTLAPIAPPKPSCAFSHFNPKGKQPMTTQEAIQALQSGKVENLAAWALAFAHAISKDLTALTAAQTQLARDQHLARAKLSEHIIATVAANHEHVLARLHAIEQRLDQWQQSDAAQSSKPPEAHSQA